MGVLGIILSLIGFSWGILIGLVVGYFLFLYSQANTVKNPEIRPLSELDRKILKRLIPELPQWVANPDYDRVDWMNKFLREMWPYLDKAVAKEVIVQTAPLIEKYKPAQIQSIDFETLTLGTLPPTLTGVKIYDTMDKEIILEPALKWAGNPNIVVAVKAFGLKATVQVAELQMFATARVTIKPLVNVFPCFDRITVSLMSKPHVDFSLKVIGGDLMAIPGLYQFAQKMIRDIVADMMLWPRTMVVYDSPTGSEVKKPAGILVVSVLAAKDLKAKDFMGKSDPYVVLKMLHFKKKTEVVKNSLNPKWAPQNFRFTVVDPEKDVLNFSVVDWDAVSSHNEMGVTSYALKSLVPEVPMEVWLPIKKSLTPDDPANLKARGEILVSLNYKPFRDDDDGAFSGGEEGPGSPKSPKDPNGAGLLRVILHEGSELEGKSHATPNPYVKIRLGTDERKTKVIKKNSDPEWEEEFEFSLEKPPVGDQLHIQVLSKQSGITSALHSKDVLGFVDIPLSDVVSNRRINDTYQLTDSKNGKLKIEMQWLTN
eukprot:TRINITY_DN18704_c0_g1_i1.p1 TRINITY_DN18704_c0_g1~~TRINITY_DN18704_c0_g1_i1.p1  ORF type:complete len:540 (+),score=131.63 TRINITY_DN18704_c0_g1_i1:106-1725(+)